MFPANLRTALTDLNLQLPPPHRYQAENDAAAAEDAAGPVDGESPEELAAWTASLGDKGDAAATKMQARQRAKQVRFGLVFLSGSSRSSCSSCLS